MENEGDGEKDGEGDRRMGKAREEPTGGGNKEG